MAKQFKDFSFCGKLFSNLNEKYISVDFDNNGEINLALGRDMEKGESNRYKVEPNFFYDTWNEPLNFELDIVKDPCKYDSQDKMEITKDEIRTLTRWLTSSHLPEWIKFEYENNGSDAVQYYGWFSNIETFVVAGIVYGLKLTFTCTTSFGYTDNIINAATSTKEYVNMLIDNTSDELNSYVYPLITIKPHSNGEIFICNTTDMEVLDQGNVTGTTASAYFESLLNHVGVYAKNNEYTVRYSTNTVDIIPLCDNSAVQFYLIDTYGLETKCTAYYNIVTKEYQIITGGFMYFNVYRDLDMCIDTQKLLINDSLGRMITYDKLGIYDVDQMYWFRLLNGTNTLLLYGDFDISFIHIESRKVGE